MQSSEYRTLYNWMNANDEVRFELGYGRHNMGTGPFSNDGKKDV